MGSFRKGRLDRARLLPPAWALFLVLLCPSAAAGDLRMQTRWSRNPCAVGRPVQLEVSVRWTGDAQRYAVRPPRLEPPEGLTQLGLTSSAHRDGDEQVLTFRWRLVAGQAATVPALPLELDVHEQGKEAPSVLEIRTEPLQVVTVRWLGLSKTSFFAVLGALVLAALAVGGWLRHRRARKPTDPQVQGEAAGSLSAALERLNACRVRGDTLSFLEEALIILSFRGREDEDVQAIRSLRDRARYGDLALSSEEMDSWYRRLKRMHDPPVEDDGPRHSP